MPAAKSLLLNANLPVTERIGPGYYDDIYTNIGNAYIALSFARQLGRDLNAGIANNLWADRAARTRLANLDAAPEWAFLNMQDQLRHSFPDHGYEIALQTLQSLPDATKLVVFSLAANGVEGSERAFVDALSPARRRFFDVLIERASTIGVRGEITASVLEAMKASNVVVAGCPTYFDAGPDRLVQPARVDDPRRVGVNGAFRSSRIGDAINYLQGDADWPMVQLLHEPDEEWAAGGGLKRAPGVLGDPGDLIAASEGRTWFFSDFALWRRHVRAHCAVVCGTRLHGGILALNAGAPAIVTNADSRARECCALFGIPWRPDLNGTDPRREDLIALADVDVLNGRYAARHAAFRAWMRPFQPAEPEGAAAPASSPQATRAPEAAIARRVVERLAQALRSPADGGGRAGSSDGIRASSGAGGDDPKNLLANPDFRLRWAPWTRLSRNTELQAWRREFGPHGWWIELRDEIGPDADLGLCAEWIEVAPGQAFALSADLAARGVRAGGVFCDVEWADAADRALAYSPQLRATAPVLRRRALTTRAPEGAARARARLYASNLVFSSPAGWLAAARVRLTPANAERPDRAP